MELKTLLGRPGRAALFMTGFFGAIIGMTLNMTIRPTVVKAATWVGFTTADEPPIKYTSVTVHTPIVKVGGELTYSSLIHRSRECRFEYDRVYINLDDQQAKIFRTHHVGTAIPMTNTPVHRVIVITIPNIIPPARYAYRVMTLSECPDGERYQINQPDVVFTVVAPDAAEPAGAAPG